MTAEATLDKQFRVDSDVKAATVVGLYVWLAHGDGSISVRAVRTAEHIAVVPHDPRYGQPWCLFAVRRTTAPADPFLQAQGGAKTDSKTPAGTPRSAKGTDGPTPVSSARGLLKSTPLEPSRREGRAGPDATAADFAVFVGTSTGHVLSYAAHTRELLSCSLRHTGGVYCLAEFNGALFSGSNDFEIVQWESSSGRFVRQLTGHSNYVRCLLAEGSLVVSGSDDHSVRVWNAATGKVVSVGRFHDAGVSALLRVGPWVWSGDDRGVVCVWRLQTLGLEATLREHNGRINAMRRAGRRVYVASSDRTVSVWDAHRRVVTSRISDHRGWALAVVAPAQLTRHFLWTAAADSTVRCWHHDEFVGLSPDLQRFNDYQWFEAGYSPYEELNGDLQARLADLEGQVSVFAHSALACRTERDVQQKAAEAAQARAERLEGELAVANEKLAMLDVTATSSADKATKLERELQALHEEATALRLRCVDTTALREQHAVDTGEMRRTLERVTAERDKLATVLHHTIQTKLAKGERPPVVLATAGDVAIHLKKVMAELEDERARRTALETEAAELTRAVAHAAAAAAKGASQPSPRRPRPPSKTDTPRGGAATARRMMTDPVDSAGAAMRALYADAAFERRQRARQYVGDRYT